MRGLACSPIGTPNSSCSAGLETAGPVVTDIEIVAVVEIHGRVLLSIPISTVQARQKDIRVSRDRNDKWVKEG